MYAYDACNDSDKHYHYFLTGALLFNNVVLGDVEISSNCRTFLLNFCYILLTSLLLLSCWATVANLLFQWLSVSALQIGVAPVYLLISTVVNKVFSQFSIQYAKYTITGQYLCYHSAGRFSITSHHCRTDLQHRTVLSLPACAKGVTSRWLTPICTLPCWAGLFCPPFCPFPCEVVLADETPVLPVI